MQESYLDRPTIDLGGYSITDYRQIAAAYPTSVSPIEVALLSAFHRYGAYPECQYRIGRRRIDFAFPQYLLAVEADGHQYHQDKEKERRRDWELERAGWAVWHIPGYQIHQDADLCVELVLEHLAGVELLMEMGE